MSNHWLDELHTRIAFGCDHYEKTAPTVHEWLNDLSVRINEKPKTVVLPELLMVDNLFDGGEWLQANHAANAVYKLLHRLGRDVSGQIGF